MESGGVILSRSFRWGNESGECVYLRNTEIEELEAKASYALNVEWGMFSHGMNIAG